MRVVGRAQQLIRKDGLYNPLLRFTFFYITAHFGIYNESKHNESQKEGLTTR